MFTAALWTAMRNVSRVILDSLSIRGGEAQRAQVIGVRSVKVYRASQAITVQAAVI